MISAVVTPGIQQVLKKSNVIDFGTSLKFNSNAAGTLYNNITGLDYGGVGALNLANEVAGTGIISIGDINKVIVGSGSHNIIFYVAGAIYLNQNVIIPAEKYLRFMGGVANYAQLSAPDAASTLSLSGNTTTAAILRLITNAGATQYATIEGDSANLLINGSSGIGRLELTDSGNYFNDQGKIRNYYNKINIPYHTGVPTFPTNGDMYYDDNLNKFQVYENGAWRDM